MREEERTYRSYPTESGDMVAFRVKVETTDLYIRASEDLTEQARAAAIRARRIIASHGAGRPEFLTSFAPLGEPEGEINPLLACMYRAARAADVGPMAAVAGAVAQYVAEELASLSPEVTVENGGDIYIMGASDALVGIHAGRSPFSGKIAIEIAGTDLPLSVCTSSATVGPSISLGCADAATIIAKDGALADAAASALGNRIKAPEDVEAALSHAMAIEGVEGALAIIGDRLGCMGNIRIARVG